LIKAFSGIVGKYPMAQLIICNGGSGSYEDIKPSLIKYGLLLNVIYKKQVSLPELVKAYNTASVFVFPTLVEGFGLPLVEAMACGCKVVTSDLPVHREITQDKAIYVNPYSANSIADGIICAFKGGILLKSVAKEYSWGYTTNLIREAIEHE